jgi:hypothetical protein
MYPEFAQAIDLRDGTGTAVALEAEAAQKKTWKPSLKDLEDQLKDLEGMV